MSVCLVYSGFIFLWRCLVVRRKTQLRILCYHRILPRSAEEFTIESALGVPVKQFQRQIAYLHKKFCIVPLAEYPALSETQDNKNKPLLSITFDDGYADNIEYAQPILQRYSAPATIFLTTGHIISRRTFWWNELSSYVNNAPGNTCNFYLGKKVFTYNLGQSGQKNVLFWQLFDFLRSVDETKKVEYLHTIKDCLCPKIQASPENSDFLSVEQIKNANTELIDFGAHTMNHVILTHVPLEQAQIEINESIRYTRSWTGCEVKTFAYPNGQKGDFNEAIKEELKRAGTSCAVTTIKGANALDADPLELRRTLIDGSDVFCTFLCKVLGLYDKIFV